MSQRRKSPHKHLHEQLSTVDAAAEKQQDSSKNYEDLVTCPICNNMFSSIDSMRMPKLLQCQHTYCVECIQHLILASSNSNNSNDKRSNQQRKEIICPECHLSMVDCTDANNLPTNRLVLSLLEKQTLSFHGHAACPKCSNIRYLNICFECQLPLCSNCLKTHFDSWRDETNAKCIDFEDNLEIYRRKIDSMGNLLTKNFEKCKSITDEIECQYDEIIAYLTNEKHRLLSQIDDVHKENVKCVGLKNEAAKLIGNFKQFRVENNEYDKTGMSGRIKRFQLFTQEVSKVEECFTELVKDPFKLLESYERSKLIDGHKILLGEIKVNDYLIEKNLKPSISKESTTAASVAESSVNQNNQQQPKCENICETTDANSSLNRWILKASKKSEIEHLVHYQTNLIAASNNMIFTIDALSNVNIYDKSYVNEFKLKNSLKLNLPNVLSIAVNSNYLAYSYYGLKKEQMKNKIRMPQTGVVMLSRDQHVVCSVPDRVIELKNNTESSFLSPYMIGLNDTHLFVCDKEIGKLFKFEIKTGSLVQQMAIDYIPSALSVNKNFLILMNSNVLQLNLLECSTFKISKSFTFKQQATNTNSTQFNSVLITDQNLIFAKTSDNQISLMDINLESIKTVYDQFPPNVQNLLMVQDNLNKMLVVVVSTDSNLKFLGYVD